MTEKIKYYQSIISGYTRDEERQTITVYFHILNPVNIASTKKITYQNYNENEQAREFFENLPIFTPDGEVDFDSLEGMHVCLKCVDVGNGWEINEAEIDSLYYAIHSEEEQELF